MKNWIKSLFADQDGGASMRRLLAWQSCITGINAPSFLWAVRAFQHDNWVLAATIIGLNIGVVGSLLTLTTYQKVQADKNDTNDPAKQN
jgi:hypothetical protein